VEVTVDSLSSEQDLLARPMARTKRFHPDENCTKAIALGLRRHRIDVTTTPEAKLRGHSMKNMQRML
jgi:hypothetical protein